MQLVDKLVAWWAPETGNIGQDIHGKYDLSESGTNPVGLASDPLGSGQNGWIFDGTNQLEVTAEGHPFTTISGGFAISAFVRPDDLASWQHIFYSGGDSGGSAGLEFMVRQTSGAIWTEIGDGVGGASWDQGNGMVGFVAGEFRHVVWNFSFTAERPAEIWSDGFLRAEAGQGIEDLSGLSLPITPSQAFRIARNNFAGIIVPTGAFGEPLTPAEIQWLYRWGRGQVLADVSAYKKLVRWAWVGAVTDTTAKVTARFSDGDNATLNVYDAAGALVASSPSQAIDPDGFATLEVAGLSAATDYEGRIQVDAAETKEEVRFTTQATGAHSYNVVCYSCQDIQADDGDRFTGLRQIAVRKPAFVLQMGDLGYWDYSENDATLFHEGFDIVHRVGKGGPYESLAQSFLWRQTPIVYTWSDHDSGPADNTVETNPALPAAQTAYRQCVPHFTLPDPDAIYHSFVVGRVRWVVLDTRSERQDGSTGLDPQMISPAQMTWLKAEIDAAVAAGEAIGLVSECNWQSGTDSWNEAYATAQREEIWNYLEANAAGRVFSVVGDQHQLAIDDGTNHAFDTDATHGVPVMCAAALVHSFHQASGTWSQSTHLGDVYGVVEVVDNGLTTLDVTLRGIDTGAAETEPLVAITVTMTL